MKTPSSYSEQYEKKRFLVKNFVQLLDNPQKTAGRAAVTLFAMQLLLLLAHFVAAGLLSDIASQTDDGRIGVFDLDQEATLAVWLSSFQLLLLSLASIIAMWVNSSTRIQRNLWVFCSGVFLFMSIDETAAVHEMLGGSMERFLPNINLSASMWWVIPYGIALAVTLLWICIRVRGSVASTAWVITGGAAWLLAVLFEFNHLFELYISVAVEEFFEMSGGLCILWGLSRFVIHNVCLPGGPGQVLKGSAM